jgi:hypothetical protein
MQKRNVETPGVRFAPIPVAEAMLLASQKRMLVGPMYPPGMCHKRALRAEGSVTTEAADDDQTRIKRSPCHLQCLTKVPRRHAWG